MNDEHRTLYTGICPDCGLEHAEERVDPAWVSPAREWLKLCPCSMVFRWNVRAEPEPSAKLEPLRYVHLKPVLEVVREAHRSVRI